MTPHLPLAPLGSKPKTAATATDLASPDSFQVGVIRFMLPSPAEKRSFLPEGFVAFNVRKDRFTTPSHTLSRVGFWSSGNASA
jgi:hypothetical protein